MKKNILVNINKGYIKHFLTMVNSLSTNNASSEFDIYIMHSNLDDADKAHIQANVAANVNLVYIYMDESLFKGAPKVKRYPYEIYYRIFAPLLLPESVERVLYLDSDLIVHNNIDELYNMDFDRIRLTVGRSHHYMNTGVMVMNIKELRKVIDTEKIFKFIKRNGWRMYLYDQDVLFKFYGDKIRLIDPKLYNLSDRYITFFNMRTKKKNKIDLNWVENNNVIIHYLGRNKPWKEKYKGIKRLLF